MATCLVTGGAGFLGSHLCEELLRRGHRVICVDNLETGSLANIEHIRDDEFVFVNARHHRAVRRRRAGRLRLPPGLARDARSTTCGCRCTRSRSAPTAPTTRSASPSCKRARFLLASTSEVYGDPQVHPQPETYWGHVNPIGPRGVYDEAKRYAEALTMAYHRQQGVDTAIVRIFNTYGPRMRPHDGRAIPTFLRQALAGQAADRLRRRQPDAQLLLTSTTSIRGLIALAESGEHLPVNIGNPDEFTLLRARRGGDRGHRLAARRSSSRRCPSTIPQVRQPDITRARELLGWEPEIELREGLRRTIDAGRRRGAASALGR